MYLGSGGDKKHGLIHFVYFSIHSLASFIKHKFQFWLNRFAFRHFMQKFEVLIHSTCLSLFAQDERALFDLLFEFSFWSGQNSMFRD